MQISVFLIKLLSKLNMKFIRFASLLMVLVLFSCSTKTEIKKEHQKDSIDTIEEDSIECIEYADTTDVIESGLFTVSEMEERMINAGLVSVPDSVNNIKVDLKYASTDNFMKMVLYKDLKNAYLQQSVMKRLVRSAEYLKENHPELNLLIYDAVRPRSVQQMMWDSLKMPIGEKVKFVSNPKNGSLHNYGCALDITLCDTNGNALDMGAGYDDIRKIAYPRYEKKYLDSGLLNSQQIQNRNLLRKVMRKGGFWGIQTEWWHFNAMRRDSAKVKFRIVE